jgi:hypothetical protein
VKTKGGAVNRSELAVFQLTELRMTGVKKPITKVAAVDTINIIPNRAVD